MQWWVDETGPWVGWRQRLDRRLALLYGYL